MDVRFHSLSSISKIRLLSWQLRLSPSRVFSLPFHPRIWAVIDFPAIAQLTQLKRLVVAEGHVQPFR